MVFTENQLVTWFLLLLKDCHFYAILPKTRHITTIQNLKIQSRTVQNRANIQNHRFLCSRNNFLFNICAMTSLEYELKELLSNLYEELAFDEDFKSIKSEFAIFARTGNRTENLKKNFTTLSWPSNRPQQSWSAFSLPPTGTAAKFDLAFPTNHCQHLFYWTFIIELTPRVLEMVK